MALLQRSEIEQLIPHRDAALWLDTITDISDSFISGTILANCTRLYGSTPEPCLLFEAAAQLCAVHGASQQSHELSQQDSNAFAANAFVAKVQQLTVLCDTGTPAVLVVNCQLLSSNQAGALYQFDICSTNCAVVSGKLLVVT